MTSLHHHPFASYHAQSSSNNHSHSQPISPGTIDAAVFGNGGDGLDDEGNGMSMGMGTGVADEVMLGRALTDEEVVRGVYRQDGGVGGGYMAGVGGMTLGRSTRSPPPPGPPPMDPQPVPPPFHQRPSQSSIQSARSYQSQSSASASSSTHHQSPNYSQPHPHPHPQPHQQQQHSHTLSNDYRGLAHRPPPLNLQSQSNSNSGPGGSLGLHPARISPRSSSLNHLPGGTQGQAGDYIQQGRGVGVGGAYDRGIVEYEHQSYMRRQPSSGIGMGHVYASAPSGPPPQTQLPPHPQQQQQPHPHPQEYQYSQSQPQSQPQPTSLSRGLSRRARIPSKDLLQSALDLAQAAVECDRSNDVLGALALYRDAVGRLRCVMERVGIELGPIPQGLGLPEPTEQEREDIVQARKRRMASASRSGEEAKTLKGIHDAYIARIGLLVVMEPGLLEMDPPIPPSNFGSSVTSVEPRTIVGQENTGGTSAIGRNMLSQGSELPYMNGHPVEKGSGVPHDRLKSGEQLVQAIEEEGEVGSQAISTDVSGYYPPPLATVPRPQARRSSLGDPAAGLGSGSPDPSVSTHPFPHDRDTPPIAESSSSSTILSPISPTDTATSSDRDSARLRRSRIASSVRSSGSQSLGLDAELEEQEAEEMLRRTPMASGFDKAEGSTLSGTQGRELPNSGTMASLPDNMSIRSRTSSLGLVASPPKISPRSASLSNGVFAGQQAEFIPHQVTKPPSRSGSISSLAGVRGHHKARSISSVLEEEEISYEMVDPPNSLMKRTSGGTPSRVPVSPEAYRSTRKESLPSAVVSGLGGRLSVEDGSQARLRTQSQPQPRMPGDRAFDLENAPPVPRHQRQVSVSRGAGVPPVPYKALSVNTASDPYSASHAMTAEPDSAGPQEVLVETSLANGIFGLQRSSPLPSPAAEPPPINPVHRPFHILRLLRNTIITPSGGFISSRLHIPNAIWSQATAKLVSLDTKVRVLEVLIMSSAALSRTGAALLVGNSIGANGRPTPRRSNSELYNAGKDFLRALEELDGMLDEMEKLLSKKLGMKASSSMKGKKMSTGGISGLGSKLTKTFDRIAAGKNVDSPTAYVDSLARLCSEAQVIDHHISVFTGASTSSYDAIQPDIRNQIDARLKRTSEFFSNYLLTFVLQDVGLLLAKYLKQSSRWLED